MIHIIGDSHCLCFEGAKNVQTHWLGAATAMNLWKKNKLIKDILNDKDKFFFLFGEIDCRIHIYNKSQETEVPEYLLVNNTVQCYVSYVATLKKEADVSIMAVHPQGVQDNYFNYPFYADRKHRQQITDLFNMWLEDICSDNRVPFIDIWYNKREFERPLWRTQDFKEDLCHVKNAVAIKHLEGFLENR